jgi:hypothetical protein
MGSVMVGLAACTLTTSLDGLTGGALDTGDGGGAVATVDGSMPGAGNGDAAGSVTGDEAGEDSAASPAPGDDGGVPFDAGVADAHDGSSVDAAASPFCASQSASLLFCDDFDEGSIAAPWDQLAQTSGSATISGVSYVSAPGAMLASVDANASVSQIDVAGYKSFTAKQGVAGTATYAFDIRIDAADESANSDAILGAIQLWNGSAYWDLELEVFYASATSDFRVAMSEDGSGGSYVPHDVTTHLPMGSWTRVTLAIVLPASFSGGATTATMAFNGTSVLSSSVNVTTSTPIPEILVGTTYATPTNGGWSVRYDNVTFAEP